MSDIIKKSRRQIEILGLLTGSKDKLSPADLEEIFHVNIPTIQRDLNTIRSWGIGVHSKKRHLEIVNQVTSHQIREILSRYLALFPHQNIFGSSLEPLLKKQKIKSILILCNLLNALENRKQIKISVWRLEKEETRLLNPYGLTLQANQWILIAYNVEKEDLRHYFLEHIKEVKVLNTRFQRPENFQLDNYFYNSWAYWTTNKEVFHIVIIFDEAVATRVKSRIWHHTQKIADLKDGRIQFECDINGIYEIGNWLMGWGNLAKVVTPSILSDYMLKKAKEIIEIY